MDDKVHLKSQKGKKHVLVIPVPLQAHIAGILTHSIELAQRGVTVTFVGLDKEISLLKTVEELQGLDFNLVSYADSGDQSELFKFLPSAKTRFQPIFDKLVEDQRAGLPGPTCIIADNLLAWVSDTAKQLNIPYYPFYTCGAIYVRVLQSYPPLFADGTLSRIDATKGPAAGKRLLGHFDGILNIPGLPALEHRDMLNSPLGIDLSIDLGNVIGESDGLIVNTFDGLEDPQVDAIRQSWIDNSTRKAPELFLAEPLSTAATFRNRSFLGVSDEKSTNCLQWLNEQPPQSVVYICVGSIASFTPAQIKELAVALEASEQGFLWVIKQGSEECLPPGFEARTRDKGLIVNGWAPQLQILQHSSIGGFVTHCGWNSIMESISSGVPMACWPQLNNDQFFNCRYLVDVLQIAVEVRPQKDTLLKSEEFERAVRTLMSSEKATALRSRIQALQKKVESAVAEGGSRQKAMDDLVQSIPS